MSDATDTGKLRADARRLYQSGNFDEAIGLLREALARLDPSSPERSGVEKGLATYLFTRGDFAGAAELFRSAKDKASDDLEAVENLGICLIKLKQFREAIAELMEAAKIDPQKANIYDGLAECYSRIGDTEAGRRHGEISLTLKDEEAQRLGQVYPLPEGSPPRFEFNEPERHIIAFSLWGENPRYIDGAIRNATLAPDIYPGWRCRFYCDDSVPERVRQQLSQLHAEVVMMPRPAVFYDGLFWRFQVTSDPQVKRFLIRDADAVINVKERVAVDTWIESGRWFHVMRDYPTHTDLILAGLWGGVGGILPPLETLRTGFKTNLMPTMTWDQFFLRQTVWPTVRQSVLIHDSLYRVFGAQTFPTIGALPPDRHVGENLRTPPGIPRKAVASATVKAVRRTKPAGGAGGDGNAASQG